MQKVKFLRDYRSPLTRENFFEAGQEWCFDEGAAAAMAAEGVVEITEPDAEVISPEGQPAAEKNRRAQALRPNKTRTPASLAPQPPAEPVEATGEPIMSTKSVEIT